MKNREGKVQLDGMIAGDHQAELAADGFAPAVFPVAVRDGTLLDTGAHVMKPQ